ncbi:hypothetical protein AVEN_185882-1 [Araneus ventricosus]|uniref:Uncharacterized protein n=1 Tax=Araneus ventricosus TaxID=182803 RepID=A0A4Y2RZL7_ARAVE|nr:hypothetical protein AVEN_185882-1 [Araneus ventricosus]
MKVVLAPIKKYPQILKFSEHVLESFRVRFTIWNRCLCCVIKDITQRHDGSNKHTLILMETHCCFRKMKTVQCTWNDIELHPKTILLNILWILMCSKGLKLTCFSSVGHFKAEVASFTRIPSCVLDRKLV